MASMQREDHALPALALVLQHPAVAASQRNICTLLQVSRLWRAAVQSSAASLTAVSIKLSSKPCILNSELPKVASLAGWLAKHSALINTLWIALQDPSTIEHDRMLASLSVSRQLIELSLKAAAADGSGSGAALRLRAYKSPIPAGAGLLAALPAATLTQLESNMDKTNWYTPLGRFTNLKHLTLGMGGIGAEATDSCLHEIGKLQQLTQLTLRNPAAPADLRVLPVQLQSLELKYKSASFADTLRASLDLQQLTNLQDCKLEAEELAAGCVLPVQLQSLQMNAAWAADSLVNLTSLRQLTSVVLQNTELRAEHLRMLEQLPRLQDLALVLGPSATYLEVAAAWHNLPLRTLKIFEYHVLEEELQQLMQHVGAASRLVELQISVVNIVSVENEQPAEPAVCRYLTGLRNLNSLCLCIGSALDQQLTAQDAQHLSVLTTLTDLNLCYRSGGPLLDAATVCSLALSLTKLKSLYLNVDNDDLYYIGLSAVFPVIGRLTNLEVLALETLDAEDAHRGLQLLTGLVNLRELHGFQKAGEEAVQAFKDTIKANRRRARLQ